MKLEVNTIIGILIILLVITAFILIIRKPTFEFNDVVECNTGKYKSPADVPNLEYIKVGRANGPEDYCLAVGHYSNPLSKSKDIVEARLLLNCNLQAIENINSNDHLSDELKHEYHKSICTI